MQQSAPGGNTWDATNKLLRVVILAVYGTLSARAVEDYLEVAARVVARYTDEELGIRYEDYAEDVARYCAVSSGARDEQVQFAQANRQAHLAEMRVEPDHDEEAAALG